MQALAPGKIILTGEHAVLYGSPAIAMAINCYAKTSINKHQDNHVLFSLLDLSYHKSMTIKGLKKLKQRLKDDYQKFQQGEFSIREVIKRPFELSQYAVSSLLEKFQHIDDGVQVKTESDIPIGCGMGSSAATTLSMLHAVNLYYQLNLEKQQYLNLALETENLQHGKSSGLDLHISLHGGCLRYHNGEFSPQKLPQFPLYIVNTGKPESSTGECVSHCKKFFDDDPNLSQQFHQVADQLQTSLEYNNFDGFKTAIKNNHQLLCQLGIVPAPITTFIEAIEATGNAAKICGAGACRGDKAGIVLIASDENPTQLCNQYGYECQQIEGDEYGLQIS